MLTYSTLVVINYMFQDGVGMDFEVDKYDILEALEGVKILFHEERNSDDEFNDDDLEEIIVLEEFPGTQHDEEAKSLALEGQDVSLFDILPEELILKIFSFLSLQELCKTISLVCKLWLFYSRCPVLWQRLSLLETSRFNSIEEVSDFILSNCPLLKHLYLQPRTELTLLGCSVLAKACPHLHSLSLSFCDHITKETLDEFVTFCPHLRDINLEGCVVTDSALEGLDKLPLQKLNASHCTHLTDCGLNFLATECHYLCSLNLDGVQWITHDAISVLVENCRSRLEHLWLDGENMTDVTVQLIAKCQKLKSFGLSFCDSLTDQSLIYIQNLVNVVSLRLKKGTEFSAEALKEMFENLHPLRTGNATGLLHVNVAECTSLNDAAIQALADSCRYLESIDISWCWEVTDAGLEHVISKCHRMLDMNICGAKDLRGNPLKNIPQLMPRLWRLDATQCNLVPDDLLDEIAYVMPQMTIINYYGEEVQPPKFKTSRLMYIEQPKSGWGQDTLQKSNNANR